MNPWLEFIDSLPAGGQQAGQLVSDFFYSGPGLVAAPFLVIGFVFMVIRIFTGRGSIGSSQINEALYIGRRGGWWK